MKLQRQIISFLQNFRPRFRVGLWKLALFLIAAPALVIPTLIYLKLLRIPPLGYYSGMAAQPIPEPQGIIHLQDGSAILLATELWLTPKGRVIWHQGISPDVTVTLPNNISPSIPETERNLTAEGLKNLKDVQLLKALDLLQQQLLPTVMR
jgi:hypothetical protein